MPVGLKLGSVLLTLACFASAEVSPPPPMPVDPEMARYRAERERRSLETAIRLSVYFACGGDREPRCEQFAPQDLRGIPPTIPLRALECRESGPHARRVRDCAFFLGDESGPATSCQVSLRQLPGPHSLYWSDALPSPPDPPRTDARTSPAVQVPGGPSSLACKGPLLALTREPAGVDPAPATPPLARTPLAALITPDDFPSSGSPEGRPRTVAMILRIGLNGRIVRCTVTGSSGSRTLDETACRLLRLRARFRPARNTEDQAVTSEISHFHQWEARR